jgi:chorismate synthase
VFEVMELNLPVGLGSYVHWDRKLDGRLAQALMSIQAIKGVEIGLGFEGAKRFGVETHDEIFYEEGRFVRRTNRAGGLEGGMSNGEPIIVRGAMKPISTQYAPMASVDLRTKAPFKASIERSDICSVPAAGVIGEAVVAFEIARAFLEKFGGDSLEELRRNYEGYLKSVHER